MNKRKIRNLTIFFCTVCLVAIASLTSSLQSLVAQTPAPEELYYTVFDRKVPLSLREDAIAVSFKSTPASSGRTTRGGLSEIAGESQTPLYLQLQYDLQAEGDVSRGLTRSGTPRSAAVEVQVNPLSEEYAIVNLLSGTTVEVQERIEAQPYVATTLPVLQQNSNEAGEAREGAIVLPNEIILSFEAGLSEAEKQAILEANQLEILHPLRFTRDRYVVRSTAASGLEVLRVTNQLNEIPQIRSATPNFIQTLVDRAAASKANETALSGSLLPMQWYLNSTPLSTCLNKRTSNAEASPESVGKCLQSANPEANVSQPRTDIRATEAWQHSNQGDGVVVAVIDSWIQWDHPDLANNLYTATDSDLLPGETHGWDFVEDDADTRISPEEFKIFGNKFEDAFLLSDDELRQDYPDTFARVESEEANRSPAETATIVRSRLANEVAGEFHGTMVAGVVAARPQGETGVWGVAPKAKLLPARVMGANSSFSLSGYLEAIAYAAARGADVINISLGSALPAQGEIELISEVLESNPTLVIVASAGNENRGELGFPAAIPGVIAVGATNIAGYRAPYSNFGFTAPNGQALTVVAPGGDNSSPAPLGRILTTGGTGSDSFWQNISPATSQFDWGPNLDARGQYRWAVGTSFSSPAVAGAIALMKGANPSRNLTRPQLIEILGKTASYEGLKLTQKEIERYNIIGSDRIPSANQYFFGSGLIDAEAAVQATKNL